MTGHTKKSETLSLRVTATQKTRIEFAATAANLSVSQYLYRRVVDRPILFTPRLAALAELISTLRRLQMGGSADPQLMIELQRHILLLARVSSVEGELA